MQFKEGIKVPEQIIHNKINEIFTECQIQNEDIDPWDTQRLEQIKTSLAELIKRISKYKKGGNSNV